MKPKLRVYLPPVTGCIRHNFDSAGKNSSRVTILTFPRPTRGGPTDSRKTVHLRSRVAVTPLTTAACTEDPDPSRAMPCLHVPHECPVYPAFAHIVCDTRFTVKSSPAQSALPDCSPPQSVGSDCPPAGSIRPTSFGSFATRVWPTGGNHRHGPAPTPCGIGGQGCYRSRKTRTHCNRYRQQERAQARGVRFHGLTVAKKKKKHLPEKLNDVNVRKQTRLLYVFVPVRVPCQLRFSWAVCVVGLVLHLESYQPKSHTRRART